MAQYPVPSSGAYPQPYYPPQPAQGGYQQQQQTGVVVVGSNPEQTPLIASPNIMSFTGQIVLSCFVFWCCGWIFGLIAFVLAIMGQNAANVGDQVQARQMSRASYAVSIAGIVVGIIIIIVLCVILLRCPLVDVSTCPYGWEWRNNCRQCCSYTDSQYCNKY